MSRFRSPKVWRTAVLAVPLLCVLVGAMYFLPPVRSRLEWRVRSLISEVRYRLNPPQEVVFVPQGQSAGLDGPAAQATIEWLVQQTLQAATAAAALTPQPGQSAVTTESPTPVPTATPVPTPIPARTTLAGFRHEYQQMNNCGPATLAMALSFWGWAGDQTTTRASLRPNYQRVDDKNVNPSEMVAFVESQTGLQGVARFGGDLDLLKRLLAAGFPVIIEKGFQPPKEDWMGHFQLLNGYDDDGQQFVAQDSYTGPDVSVAYADLAQRWWRDFNYAYVVLFPPERQAEVLSILGPHAGPVENFRLAADKARAEIPNLQGRDLFFAWYNLGSSLVGLQDYPAAAQAYDQAFAVYAALPEEERPWRTLWYQDGPYAAYYHTGRYEDVLTLGNQTLNNVGGPILEESFYWMGLAREAIGDLEKAIYDFQKAVEINPYSTPALRELDRLGVAP